MWCNQPFSQRHNTTEIAVVVGVGGNKEGVRWKKSKKKGWG